MLVLFATSMGQAAILRPEHEGFAASVPDLSRLIKSFGLKDDQFSTLMAMAPYVAIEVRDNHLRSRLIEAMLKCHTPSGERVFKIEEISVSLSIEVRTPRKQAIETGGFMIFKAGSDTGEFIPWKEAGIKMNLADAGTGYHIPDGVMAVYGEGDAGDLRTPIAADKIKNMILERSGFVRG